MAKYRNYDPAKLQQAVADVKSGTSYRKASRKYGIPVMTISDRVTGKREANLNLGRPSVLAPDLEQDIVQKLKVAAARGFGITRRQLVIKVARICRRLRLKTNFKNGVPGKGWVAKFIKRHPDVILRTPVALSTVRARMLNETVTKKYFDGLCELVSSLGLAEKPHLIWNIDETGVSLTHRPSKVFAEKGMKNVPGRVGNDRDRVSVLACINAAGGTVPPMAIVKGKTQKSLQAYNTAAGVPGTAYTYQERAWMEDVLGERWLEDHFLQHCGPERPQVIVLDSHSSHETVGFLEKAISNDIHVIAFPPHTTQWLCPLDKSVFGPFSREWNSVCTEYMSVSPNNTVCKWEWPRLFRAAYDRSFTKGNITSGFKKCGIYPINPSSIPASAFAPSHPFDQTPLQATKTKPIQSNDTGASGSNDSLPSSSHESESASQALPFHVPEGSQLLSAEDFVLSVLSGDVPITLDDGGNMTISLEHLPHNASTPDVSTPESNESIDLSQLMRSVTETNAVSSEFTLPEPQRQQSQNSRRITSHRILTSESILALKREKVEQKKKTEALKQARKQKREARKSEK